MAVGNHEGEAAAREVIRRVSYHNSENKRRIRIKYVVLLQK
jgi:hypothetical protein